MSDIFDRWQRDTEAEQPDAYLLPTRRAEREESFRARVDDPVRDRPTKLRRPILTCIGNRLVILQLPHVSPF